MGNKKYKISGLFTFRSLFKIWATSEEIEAFEEVLQNGGNCIVNDHYIEADEEYLYYYSDDKGEGKSYEVEKSTISIKEEDFL